MFADFPISLPFDCDSPICVRRDYNLRWTLPRVPEVTTRSYYASGNRAFGADSVAVKPLCGVIGRPAVLHTNARGCFLERALGVPRNTPQGLGFADVDPRCRAICFW